MSEQEQPTASVIEMRPEDHKAIQEKSMEEINKEYSMHAQNLGHLVFQQTLLFAQVEDAKQKMMQLGIDADKLRAEQQAKDEAAKKV